MEGHRSKKETVLIPQRISIRQQQGTIRTSKRWHDRQVHPKHPAANDCRLRASTTASELRPTTGIHTQDSELKLPHLALSSEKKGTWPGFPGFYTFLHQNSHGGLLSLLYLNCSCSAGKDNSWQQLSVTTRQPQAPWNDGKFMRVTSSLVICFLWLRWAKPEGRGARQMPASCHRSTPRHPGQLCWGVPPSDSSKLEIVPVPGISSNLPPSLASTFIGKTLPPCPAPKGHFSMGTSKCFSLLWDYSKLKQLGGYKSNMK